MSSTSEPLELALSVRHGRRLSSSRISEQRYAYLLTVPVAIVLLAVVIFPTLYSLYMSVFDINAVLGTWNLTGLGNYAQALTTSGTWQAIFLTVAYIFWMTVLAVGIALLGALLLNESFKGRNFVISLVILPWAVSLYAAAVVWRYMYSQQFGLFNSVLHDLGVTKQPVDFITQTSVLPLIALAHAWQFAPLGMYFMLATLQFVPGDLYKLARTDKLSVWGRFRHVTLPYLKAPILIYLILVTAEAAKAFDITYFISGGGPGTASQHLVFLIYQETFQNLNLGYGAALSWILLVLVTAITLAYFWAITRRREVAIVEMEEEIAQPPLQAP